MTARRLIKIERRGISLYAGDGGADDDSEPDAAEHPEYREEDLDLLSHLRSCLFDGAKTSDHKDKHGEHQHPRDESWFLFFGRRLWKRFPPTIERSFLTTERTRVLLEVNVDRTDRLGQVLGDAPWEFSRFPTGMKTDEPLGTSDRVAVSRYVRVTSDVKAHQPIGTRLRVLFIGADESAGTVRRGAVLAALTSHPAIEVTPWTPEQVRNCIATVVGRGWHRDLADSKFDVIVVLGHGRDDHGTVRVRLSEDYSLATDEIATLVRDRCRVVILDSCSSAAAVQEILRAGPLAVIAMLYEINVDRLLQFNLELFKHLMQGFALDTAVQKARRALDEEARVSYSCAPVLYVRTKGVVRLDPDRPQPIDSSAAVATEPEALATPSDALVAVPPPPVQPARPAIISNTGGTAVVNVLADRSEQ